MNSEVSPEASPDTREDLRDFRRNLPMALLRAREAVMARFRPILRQHGVTEQQWRVIRALHGEDGLEITALSERTLLVMPSLTRILKGMEAQGWVRRLDVPGDKRRRRITISPSGEALFARISPQSERVYRRIEAEMGDRDLTQLYAQLSALSTVAQHP